MWHNLEKTPNRSEQEKEKKSKTKEEHQNNEDINNRKTRSTGRPFFSVFFCCHELKPSRPLASKTKPEPTARETNK